MRNMDKGIQKRMGWGTVVTLLSHFLILSFPHSLSAQPTDTVRADFFRDYYHQGHLVHWLDALSDHTVYQGLHVGQWDESGQLMFSVDGNSFRWNRFYIDGMRLDNRFAPGSTNYVPNMEHYNLSIDSHASVLSFQLDTTSADYVQVSWNRGNLGGINKTRLLRPAAV